jgi:hypothetical protein
VRQVSGPSVDTARPEQMAGKTRLLVNSFKGLVV